MMRQAAVACAQRRWIASAVRAGLLVAFLASIACSAPAGPPPVPPPTPTASASPAAPPPPAPGWPYWNAVPADVHPLGAPAPKLPLDASQVERREGAGARWAAAPEAVRGAVLADGFAVDAQGTQRTRFGRYYRDLADAHVPAFVTLDTLLYLSHVARNRALADVEASAVAPALDTLLSRLMMRLSAETAGAPVDLLAGYRIARGLVAVAATLKNGADAAPPDLRAVVQAEVSLITAHAGVSKSPLLDAPIDYSVFTVRGALSEEDTRAGTFRAATWLAYAPLAVIASTEQATSTADVGGARNQMRAALLLSRLVQPDVDPEAARAWTRLSRLAELVVGHPADMSAAGLSMIARSAGLDLHDARAIADVVRLDHARHAVGHARPGVSFRLVDDRVAPDAAVLQAIVAPAVAKRTMPSALDVGAWLGSAEAKRALHDAGVDAIAGYSAALDAQIGARPPKSPRHASFYETAIDALSTYVDASGADETLAAASSDAWRRHKLEVTLAGWSALRHDSLPFSRFVVPAVARAEGAPAILSAVYVEPHPEAIAKLLGLVRQVTRGLDAMTAASASAPCRSVLADVEAILSASLAASIEAASDRPPPAEAAQVLASLPARVASIEARVAGTGDEDTALVVDVHTDLDASRVLEEATGELDDLFVVVREPSSGRLVLAVGPTLAHYELESSSDKRLSDAAVHAMLLAGTLTRDPFAASGPAK